MDWKITELKIDDADFYNTYRELSDQHHPSNHFLDVAFLKNIIEVNNESGLIAATWCNSDVIQALLILKKRTFGRWELYKPAQAQIGLALSASDARPSLERLFKALPGIVVKIDLRGLDPLEHQPFLTQLKPDALHIQATDITLDTSDLFDNYWASRSKNLRKNMNRYENRLKSEHSDIVFFSTKELHEIKHAVDRYGLLESKGWKGNAGTALHPSNYQGVFYSKWLSELAARQQALAYELWVDDILVASRLCCKKNGVLIILKTAYDERFKHLAPGRLLLKKVISDCFSSSSIATIDFYTNATPEQLDWSTAQRSLFNADVYSNSAAGKIFNIIINIKNWCSSLSLRGNIEKEQRNEHSPTIPS